MNCFISTHNANIVFVNMSNCGNSFIFSTVFTVTIRAVYNLVIGAICNTSCFNFVFNYCSGGIVPILFYSFVYTRNLFFTLGAIYNLVIATIFGTSCGYFIFFYRRAGGVSVGSITSGLVITVFIVTGFVITVLFIICFAIANICVFIRIVFSTTTGCKTEYRRRTQGKCQKKHQKLFHKESSGVF